MMYVQEYISPSGELADRWINPAHVISIQPPSDQLKASVRDDRCVLTLTDGRAITVSGGSYIMQSWWWDHAKPPQP